MQPNLTLRLMSLNSIKIIDREEQQWRAGKNFRWKFVAEIHELNSISSPNLGDFDAENFLKALSLQIKWKRVEKS